VEIRPSDRVPGGPASIRPRDAAFLDTETTGLAGGTGTVAFLVGVGRVEGDAFVVRQHCMRDFPEEAALLHAVREDLGDAPLVTFNGRAFDWPLLTTRYRLHRMPLASRPHLDLLPAARRLWADTLPSRSLSALEAGVLGLLREDDLPGWRIPEAWFAYLRTGRSDAVAQAFRHNEQDVVSMLALLGRVGSLLAAPPERVGPGDALGTARLLVDLRQPARARRCLRSGLEALAGEAEIPLRRLLGRLCRQAGDHEEALEHWRRVAERSEALDAEAVEECAKLLEHRRRDAAAALALVEDALPRLVPGSGRFEAFRRRAERLARKVRAVSAPGP
jgi:tetratricopeptide (TPR) repeat protein